jgi:hypothetical protein
MLHGALLGAWWGVCVFAAMRASELGWGLVALDAGQGRDAFRWDEILHLLSARIGLGFIDGAWAVVPLASAAGALAGSLVTLISRVLQIDPEQIASRPLRELAQRKAHLLCWLAPGAALVLVACLPGATDWFWLPVFAWGAVLPFLLLHDDVVAAPARANAWRPNWPGAVAIGTAFGVLLVSGIADKAAGAAFELLPLPAGIAAQSVALLVGLLATVVATAAWLDRSGPRQLHLRLRGLLGRRSLGAMLAMQVRMAIVVAWLSPPFVVLAVSSIWVWTQLAEFAESGHLPFSASRLEWLRLIANEGLLSLAAMLAPVFTFCEGRLYRLVFPAQDSDIANAA